MRILHRVTRSPQPHETQPTAMGTPLGGHGAGHAQMSRPFRYPMTDYSSVRAQQRRQPERR
jgi:hypothetical protein